MLIVYERMLNEIMYKVTIWHVSAFLKEYSAAYPPAAEHAMFYFCGSHRIL